MTQPWTPQTQRAYQHHLGNLAKVLSGQYEGKGRSVKRLKVGPSETCATNGDTVFLSYPIMEGISDNMNLILTEAILAHEAAGHLRYTNFNAWKSMTDAIKRGEEDRLMHDFVNIFEDARVNYLLGKDFAGSKKRLDMAQRMMMETHKAGVVGRVIDDSEAPKMGVIAIATEAILSVGHFINHPKVIAMMDEARPLFADALAAKDTNTVVKGARAVLAVFRKHFPEDECGGSEYGASTSPEGEGLFSDDMSVENIEKAANSQKRNKAKAQDAPAKRFKDLLDKMPTGDSTQDGDGPAAGDADGDGESAGGDAGDGDEAGDEAGDAGSDGAGDGQEGGAGDGDADGEGEGDGSGKNALPETRADDLGSTAHTTEGDNDEAKFLGGATGSENAIFAGEDLAENLFAEAQAVLDGAEDLWFPEDADLEDLTVDYAPEDTGERVNDGGHLIITQENPMWRNGNLAHSSAYDETKAQTKGAVKRVAKTLENLIKGADTRETTHHKRGKLDDRRLWAVRSSDRLFTKPKTYEDFKLRCVILIDASGSMSGRRARQAAKAAVALSEAMEAVGADYEVVDFNSSNGAVRGHDRGATYINVRKGANDTLTQTVKRQIATPYAGSQNSDGYAVKWAMNRTKQFGTPDARRMVFIISDGSPCGPAPYGMGSGSHLRAVLAEAEKDDCILFSVGIAGMDTSEWYANHGHARVQGMESLATDILVPLKMALKKALKKKMKVVAQ